MTDSEREDMAKQLIEKLGEIQDTSMGMTLPCPRCGRQMNPESAMNALSRRAKVDICSTCGMDEAEEQGCSGASTG